MNDRLETPTNRLAVRVTKDAERQIRSGHPWVFDRSVQSVKPSGSAGDLAVVFDSRRRFLAIGLYDPTSPIRIKILHSGEPTPIDDDFFVDRIAAAIERRGSLVGSRSTTAYRVVHGENDAMPGFVLDRYDETGVLKLYSAAWIPWLPTLVPIIEVLCGFGSLIVRFSRQVGRGDAGGMSDGDALLGETPSAPVEFVENELSFAADVVAGHKTGHFLDQRDNRLTVRSLAAGASVLDVFACTGGFSVNAAAGGATDVLSVDISEPAIEAARANMERNSSVVAACRHDTTVGDAFAVMEDLAADGHRYDLVVVDPPSFASSQSQVRAALRSYARLSELAAKLTRPGRTVMLCSCSSRVDAAAFADAVSDGARMAGRRLCDQVRTGHAIDHPIGFAHGEYLKAIRATVEPN